MQDRYRNETQYDEIIKRVDSVFNRNNIHIIFFEDLFNATTSNLTITKLCHFLEIDYKLPTKRNSISTKANATEGGPMPIELRESVNQYFEPLSMFLNERVGHVPETWFND